MRLLIRETGTKRFCAFSTQRPSLCQPTCAQNDYTCIIFTYYCIIIWIIRACRKDLLHVFSVQLGSAVVLLSGFLYDEMTGGPRYSVYVLGFDLLGVLYIPGYYCIIPKE